MYTYIHQNTYKNVHRSPIGNSQKLDGMPYGIRKNKLLLHNLYKSHKYNTGKVRHKGHIQDDSIYIKLVIDKFTEDVKNQDNGYLWKGGTKWGF